MCSLARSDTRFARALDCRARVSPKAQVSSWRRAGHIDFSSWRMSLELAQSSSRVALAWDLARRGTPFWVTCSLSKWDAPRCSSLLASLTRESLCESYRCELFRRLPSQLMLSRAPGEPPGTTSCRQCRCGSLLGV